MGIIISISLGCGKFKPNNTGHGAPGICKCFATVHGDFSRPSEWRRQEEPSGSHSHFMYGETEVSVACPRIRRITGIMDAISLNNNKKKKNM